MSNQSVHITFKKGGVKPSSAIIKRNDGSEIFLAYQNNLIYHDLAHFAIESTLMKKVGFFWLINLGLEPKDFELPKEKQPQLFKNALNDKDHIAIEYLANQLMVEALNSGPIQNFMEVLFQGMQNNGDEQLSFSISNSVIEDIRELYQMIVSEWRKMPEGKEKKVMVFYPEEDDRIKE